MVKVELIARSIEKNQNLDYDLFNPENIKKDLMIMSGRAAGICYMPDNYLDEGVHNSEKALQRASFNAKSGHYSVYEHAHLTFMIECPKIVAMVLNSTRLYATSEKSARYTKMNPDTELEVEMYSKWLEIFKSIIADRYVKIFTDKELEKLAMENARYLTSVFTMTTMEFTIPYGRAILLIEWLENFANDISIYPDDSAFFERLALECRELSIYFRNIIGEDKNIPTLVDHKNIGIRFFADKADYTGEPYYGDIYSSYYNASFAAIAQLQRHRTLNYKINPSFDIENIYIPKIIRETEYEKQWIEDTFKLFNQNIYTQNLQLLVNESGRFEDFVLKAKERLCARAQKEVYDITKLQLYEFQYNQKNMCDTNKLEISKMLNKDRSFSFRCSFDNYRCKEPCKLVKYGATRII